MASNYKQSMAQSDSTYSLIKSLSKPEKSYFKKYASRHVLGKQNKYVALFDAISKSNNGYDERQIKKLFAKEKFVKNFPVMKKYLFGMILKSLNNYYADSDSDREVKSKIHFIEILYKKGLFRVCKKILGSALRQAYDTDNFPAVLELIRWKKNLIYENVYEGNEFTNLESAHNEEMDIIRKLENLSRYRMLSYRVQSLAKRTNPLLKDDEAPGELSKIKNDELLQDERCALSYHAVVAYYHVRSLIHESLAENSEAIRYRKKLVEVLEAHSAKLSNNITNYIVSVFNLLGPCLVLKEYGELQGYINKLRSAQRDYTGRLSENDLLLIFLGSSIFELRMNINAGNFSRSDRNIYEIENGLAEFSNKLVRNDVLHCYYLLGYANFGAGKFESALGWINKILNSKDADHDSNLYVKARILNLVIHYELNNFELLEYLIKSTFRFLNRSGRAGNDELVIIKFLKKLPSIGSRYKIADLFAESLHELRLTRKNFSAGQYKTEPAKRFEIQNVFTDSAEFDLESWLESKITGLSFEEAVKQKTPVSARGFK